MGGGVGGMVYSIRNGQRTYSHANHRGDVIARTDDNRSLTSFALYEAYGTRPYEWNPDGDPDRQKANTKEEESDLGLLNEGMRFRDLETGVFLTRDPLRYGPGPNIYCYVNCNPITNFNPLGLEPKRGTPLVEAWAAVVNGVSFVMAKIEEACGGQEAVENFEMSVMASTPTIPYDDAAILVYETAIRNGRAMNNARKLRKLEGAVDTMTDVKTSTKTAATKADDAAEVATELNKQPLTPKEKGDLGVAASKQQALNRGETVLGEEVSFKLPEGGRTRADLVTETTDGDLKIIESKNGPTAKLTERQAQAQSDVAQGKQLTPVGKKAEEAGLKTKEPVTVTEYQVDHHDIDTTSTDP